MPEPDTDAEGADFAEQVAGVAALAEPVRLSLYRYVAAQLDAVSRDEAAEGVGVPRHSAKFHLDRLVDEGLLAVEFRRLTGREGPGAGRPAKLYRRSAAEVSVSLPPRHYDLAGELMATAIELSADDGGAVTESLHVAAAQWGTTMADQVRKSAGPRPSQQRIVAAACSTLAAHGYEPRLDAGTVTLRNCPFHALAQRHTDLVCGMNLAAMDALTACAPSGRLSARLDPGPDRCCVRLVSA